MAGEMHLSWTHFNAFLDIIFINLALAGDNAVVIAMAVRSLPRRQRLLGIALGSGGAVVLRVVCTFLVAQLLLIRYVKLFGGLVIIGLAVKLLLDNTEPEDQQSETNGLAHAFWIILFADISMSIDNMLAVAAASQGNFFLLLFGLGLSIPFVMFTSNLLATLMDRYPVIIYIGAAVLAKVGADMMVTDPWVNELFHPSKLAEYSVQALFTVAIVATGLLLSRMRSMPERHKAPERPAASARPALPAEERRD